MVKKRSIYYIVLLVLVHQVLAYASVPLRINSAGQDYTDSSGNLWLADKAYSSGSWGYVGGSTVNRWDANPGLNIAGTNDDALYVTERWDLSSYKIDVSNGQYEVILHFAETNANNGPGDRVFNVLIEGQYVLINFDVYTIAGYANAINRVVSTTVNDEQLNIDFQQVNKYPMINAIEVHSVSKLIGDTNGDGKVTLADLIIFIANFGKISGFDSKSDINTDGKVNLFDIVLVASNMGNTGPAEPQCGDGLCESGETCSSCSSDCGTCPPPNYCGDGTCDPDESCSTCYQDCGACQYCGNGLCDSAETCSNCPGDCGSCPPPNYCGDGTCDPDESCSTCYQDCGSCPPANYCGDGTCNADEDCNNCQQDCGSCPIPSGDCTHYISTSGSDSASGTSMSNAWRTVSKANSALQPGDTACILSGNYQDQIRPSKSGTATNRITYKNYAGQTVTIQGQYQAIYLSSRNYITVDGINVNDYDMAVLFSNAKYNWIKNMKATNNRQSAGNPVAMRFVNGASFNWVYGCNIGEVGKIASADDKGDMIVIGNNGGSIDVTGNLIEHCTLFRGGHNVFLVRAHQNIIRNNYFYSDNWMSGGLYGSRDGAMGHQLPTTTHRNLFDGNRVAFSGVQIDNPDQTACMKVQSPQNILRNNVYFHCISGGIHIQTFGSLVANDNRVYNNVFFHNGVGGLSKYQYGLNFVSFGPVVSGTVVKNNIFYRNTNGDWSATAGKDDLALHTFSYNFRQSQGDPMFVDVSTTPTTSNGMNVPDFHLRPQSPAIDAGTWLTTIQSSSGSGTQMVVADVSYFFDGWGAVTENGPVPGDTVQVQGRTQRAVIKQIDYNNNIIILNSPLSWNKGDGLSLAYNGAAPDQGAYET